MARTNYLRAITILTVATIAAIVAVLVANGPASAQGDCGTLCDPGDPTVVGTKPKDGAADVKTNRKIKAKFSKAMDKSTINNNTVRLKRVGGDCGVVCHGADRVKYKKRTAKLIPAGGLQENSEYRVTIKGGKNGVKDKQGNPMRKDFTWTFTTGAE